MATAREYSRRRDQLIGDRINARRTQLGLRLSDVSEEFGKMGFDLSVQRISQMERGGSVDLQKLLAFATVLQCSLSYLVALTTDPDKWEPDDRDFVATRVKRKGKVPPSPALFLAHSN